MRSNERPSPAVQESVRTPKSMRKIVSVLFALLFLFCSAVGTAETFSVDSPEQEMADKLHEEYNIWVVLCEKAYDRARFFSDSYSIHPAEESVSLLKGMLSTSYTLEALEVLESELSRYPKGFSASSAIVL